jgi:hypothetical protein
MENLYRKVTYPSGSVRYVKVNTMFYTGDPADGLWYVKRDNNGKRYTLITERLEDLPRARKLAELEPLKDIICKAIVNTELDIKEVDGIQSITIPSANTICNKIFNDIIEEEYI